jgi:hypothetical protein
MKPLAFPLRQGMACLSVFFRFKRHHFAERERSGRVNDSPSRFESTAGLE